MPEHRPGGDDFRLTDKRDLLEQNSSCTEELFRSFCYSAVQSPLSGAAQLIDRASADVSGMFGGKSGTSLLPKVQFMDAPRETTFGSREWHAQQVGSAAGLAADLVLVSMLSRKSHAGLERMSDAELSALGRREIRNMALTGVVLGGVFTPVKSGEDFWQSRLANAGAQGLTFGTLAAGTVGLRSAGRWLEKGERWGGKILQNEIAGNILAGVPAGVMHAHSDSLLHGKGFAGWADTGKSVYSFATVGGILGTYGGLARLAESSSPRSGEVSLRRTESRANPELPTPTLRLGEPGARPGVELKVDAPKDGTTPRVTEGGPKDLGLDLQVGSRSKRVLDDGTVVVEFPAGSSNGTRRILTKTDGTKIYERVDGQKKTVSPDGTKVTEYFTGEIRQVTERLDGSKTTEYNSGEKSTKLRDGTVISEYPAEGKTITERPDGTIITEDALCRVTDIDKVDLVQEKLHREVHIFDKRTGKTTVEVLNVSRQGDYMSLDGHLGRRRVTFGDPGKGARVQHEVVEFSRGPVERLERMSDGTWMKQYREGPIKAEAHDYVNGELVRFLQVEEGQGTTAVQRVRKDAPKEVIVVRGDNPTVFQQTHRPDGRIEVTYTENAWKQDGQVVSSETIYPDGTVARVYSPRTGTADSALVLSGGVRLTELRQSYTGQELPTFELGGPDGSTFNLKGGQVDLNGAHGRATGDTSGRLPLDLEGAPTRYDHQGQYMTPFDVYEGKAGSMRYLYRDGTVVTVTRGGRSIEIKFKDGVELSLQQNGTMEVKQPGGATHTTEFGNLRSYKDSVGNKHRFE